MEELCKSHVNVAGAKYLSAACEYVNSHYRENISIGDVAKKIGISSSYLSHLYKDGLNVTFTEYLSGTRIDAAKELLRETDMTVSQVAQSVGFDDTNYFTRTFKRIVGISPKQY